MDLRRKQRRLETIEEKGLWPFISRRIYRRHDGSHHVWQSRHHRRGLSVFAPLELLPLHILFQLGLWLPKDLMGVAHLFSRELAIRFLSIFHGRSCNADKVFWVTLIAALHGVVHDLSLV